MNTMLDANIDTQIVNSKRSKQSLGISIPILITIMITYYMNQNISLYISIINIFCASLGAALSIIAIMRDEVKEGALYKYIGYGFMFISMLAFAQLIIRNFPKETSIFFERVINDSTFIMEYIIIIIAFRLKKKDCSTIKSIIFYFLVVAIIITSIVCVYSSLDVVNGYENFYKTRNLVLLVLAVGTGITAIIKKDKLPKQERYFLGIYIIFVMIYHSLFILSMQYSYECRFEIGIFKYMSYYMLYELVAEVLLYKAYDNMKLNLVEAQRMQKELNNTLSYRNKMLVEVKSLIEKSESRYSNLIEAIKDGVIIFYFDRLSYINGAALSIIGKFDEDQIIGTSFKVFAEDIYTEYSFTPKEDYGESLEQIISNQNKLCKIFVSNTEGKEFEMYFLRIDSLNRLVYIRDITEMNKNHELRRQYDEYLKEEKLKNQFYSNISHELRTPINLIYSALQINEIYLRDGKLNKIERNNETIKQNSLRLIRTINNFIDTNKISEGYFPKNMKIYNIVSVVENISLVCNKYIEKIENTLIFDSVEEEIYVECDKEMMERIILNLLSNSVKYGKKGGTVLVDIQVEDDDAVIIYVKNNGYSIDEKLHPYIFDKFTKINKSFNREKEGSGLGLFLAKALTELQGGSIEFRSNNEIGTEFKITLERCYEIERAEQEEIFEMNTVEEKVDTEFSDIYL